MLDSILFHELLVKLLPLLLTSVAGGPCVGNISELFNCGSRGDRLHVMHFQPLRVCINDYKEHFPFRALHSQCEFWTKGVLAAPRGVMVLLWVHSDLTDICRSPSPSSQSPGPCPATIHVHSFVSMLSCKICLGGSYAAQ